MQIVHRTHSQKKRASYRLPARVMNFHGKLLFPEIQILQLPPLEYLDGKQRSLNSGVVKFQGRAVPSSLINLSTAESPYQGWNLSCWCLLPGARLLLELETHTHSRCGFFPAGSLTDAKTSSFSSWFPFGSSLCGVLQDSPQLCRLFPPRRGSGGGGGEPRGREERRLGAGNAAALRRER